MSGRVHARCSKRVVGPLEWWAVPFVYKRKARTPLPPGPSAEGGGANAVRVGVAGGVGVTRAGAAVGALAKRRRIGPKVAQATSSSTPSLADLARQGARSGELVRPPPPLVIQ